jgi:hypothetical protein
MSSVWILLGTAVLLTTVIIMFVSPNFKGKVLATATGPFELTKQETVVPRERVKPYYQGPEGTFSAYLFLGSSSRTGVHAPCGTNPNQPCTNGQFDPCPCTASTGDCSVCAHKAFSSVFNLDGIVGVEVITAPDASRQGTASAQLLVQTEGPPPTGSTSTTAQKYIETMILPPIPLQKWTMVTVAREGRRFDIYYNDRIVLSKKTMYMPSNTSIVSNFSGLVSGSPGLSGQLALLQVFSTRYSSADVAGLYKSSSDTRGRPYVTTLKEDITGLLPTASPDTPSIDLTSLVPSINICPPGGCFNTPVIRPASPLYDWTTQYG